MKFKRQILGLILVVTIITIVFQPIAFAHTPIFYCQAAGDYEGGYWGEGVPDATKSAIRKEGCAISCCAMILYPSETTIYDERVGETRSCPADPYVVYRANGDSCVCNWYQLAIKFGWSNAYHDPLSGEPHDKALVVDAYLDDGYHPSGRIPGHFILFVSSLIEGPLSVTGKNLLRESSITYEAGLDTTEIDPITDEEAAILFGDAQPIKASTTEHPLEDYLFKIHDPGTRYGKNIDFADNIHDSTFYDLDRLTIMEP